MTSSIFQKMESGGLQLEKTEFSVIEVIDSIFQLLRPRYAERSVMLRSFVSPALPEMVVGDPGRLRQILINLLGNAIKFTEAGSVTLEVPAPSVIGGAIMLHFNVTDTGIGISNDAQKRLFNPFSQADASSTRKYGGTGLGLAICRRLCERMGGNISVQSAPGEGSTFRFSIRCNASDRPKRRTDAPVTPGTALWLRSDNTADSGLSLQLDAFGIRSQPVGSAPEAAQYLKDNAADVSVVALECMTVDKERTLANEIFAGIDLPDMPVWIVAPDAVLESRDDAAPSTATLIDVPIRQKQVCVAVRSLLMTRTPGLDVGRPPCAAVAATEPQAEIAAETHAPDTDAAAIDEADGGTEALHALLVEDNRVNQHVASAILEIAGIRVTIAEDGHEALEALEKDDFDFILMDIHMPRMDGIAATKAIRALAPPKCAVPIIAVTANAMKGDREKYIAAGMDDYVSKPVSPEMLTEAISRQAGREISIRALAPQQTPQSPQSTNEKESGLDALLRSMGD